MVFGLSRRERAARQAGQETNEQAERDARLQKREFRIGGDSYTLQLEQYGDNPKHFSVKFNPPEGVSMTPESPQGEVLSLFATKLNQRGEMHGGKGISLDKVTVNTQTQSHGSRRPAVTYDDAVAILAELERKIPDEQALHELVARATEIQTANAVDAAEMQARRDTATSRSEAVKFIQEELGITLDPTQIGKLDRRIIEAQLREKGIE